MGEQTVHEPKKPKQTTTLAWGSPLFERGRELGEGSR